MCAFPRALAMTYPGRGKPDLVVPKGLFFLDSVKHLSPTSYSTGQCSPTLHVSASALPLVKTVDVAGFLVGSSVDLTFDTPILVSSLPSGSSVTIDAYAYTTIYFKCQDSDGGCPPDESTDVLPLAISSPFDAFAGQCNANADGFFLVCLYAGKG